jgi:hypothetical protein
MLPDPDRLLTIRVFENLTEAISARALLETADIDCFLADEHTFRIAGPFHFALGVRGVRLQVRVEDATRALELLDTPEESG